MIKNVKLKVLLQNSIFRLLSIINKKKKHDNGKILLYNNGEFRDNVKALCDYLIEEKYNDKYKIVCSSSDYKEYKKIHIKNLRYISNIRAIFEYFSAGYVYYRAGKIPIVPGKTQTVVQMWHGSPYKKGDEGMINGHLWSYHYYTYVFSASKNFAPIWSNYFSMPLDCILICGYPRCDALFKKWEKYNFGKYKKLILWTPTFKTSKIIGYNNVKTEKGVVPVVDSEHFVSLNEKLKKMDVKVIVKLHPAQRLDKYCPIDMENLIIISHDEFTKRGIDLYKLMTQCDALITDYSSIFYDFLLLDRPLAFTEDDIEEYGELRGFAVDNPDAYKPGHRIKKEEDLISFVEDVVNEVDNYKDDRKRVLDLSNDYRDGKFCLRALDLVGIKKD